LLVLASVGLALVLGFIYTILRPQQDIYTAEATIVLQDPVATEDAIAGGVSERFVVSQAELLGSTLIAGEASRILAESDPPVEIDPADLIDQSYVSSSNDSSLVIVGATDSDPDQAVALVNAIAEGYRQVSRSQVNQSTDAAVGRIDAQIESIESRLGEVRQEITDAIAADDGLAELTRQAEEAVAQIAELQDDLVATTDTTQQAVIRQKIEDLRDRLTVYSQVTGLASIGSGYNSLISEQEQLLGRRADLIQLRDQVAIDGELAPDAVALLGEAETAVLVPQSGLGRALAVALILGAAVGLGLAFWLETRRRTFADRLGPESVLGAPLLADIPDFTAESLTTRLPVWDAPRSAAAEAFRFAATSLEYKMRASGATSVMVVAGTLGHGKTTVLVNTAMAVAGQNSSVLVVDCDFGNQDATSLLVGAEAAPALGFTDVVETDVSLEDAVETIRLGNEAAIRLLSRGGRPTVAANVVLAPAARGVFSQLKQEHGLVFVDAPPLLQVAYSSALAGYVDGLVVIVAHGTPVKELEDLANRLKLIGTPILGYLYNRSPLRPEMTATEGSMMDILGVGKVAPPETRARSRR
jgi:Mrp family chromosome partitioning ATPase/capsular polysaccharide biosynthesis protein